MSYSVDRKVAEEKAGHVMHSLGRVGDVLVFDFGNLGLLIAYRDTGWFGYEWRWLERDDVWTEKEIDEIWMERGDG